jgi:hypothetical protein
MQRCDTHEPASGWIPLAVAPVLNYVGGYEIGYRLQASGDFRRRTGTIKRVRSKRPRFAFEAEWPDVAQGGRASIALFRVKGCKGSRYKLRKVATYRGRFGAKRMRLKIRRPRRVGYYFGRFAFSGTHVLRAGVDPNPVLLLALRGRVEFVSTREFPGCPGYRP